MLTVRIWGSSDDLVEFEDVTTAVDNVRDGDSTMYGSDAEFDVYDVDSIYEINGQVRVQAYFSPNGTWSFAVGMVDNDKTLWPGWPMRMFKSENNGYSMEVEIEIMDDTADVVRIQ